MPDLQLLQPWLLECGWCARGVLVFTLPGVMPDKPPRGWYAVPGGDWVCDRHSMNVEAMGPSDADYPAVIEVPE